MNLRSMRIALVLALALSTVATSSCAGRSHATSKLEIAGAWARTTPPGAVDGVAYLSITSPVDDELVDVRVPTDVAARAELHETMANDAAPMAPMPGMDHGGSSSAMTMKPLSSVALPAHRAVRFEPGAKHVMLRDLSSPLQRGQVFTITLVLRVAGPHDVRVSVADNPT